MIDYNREDQFLRQRLQKEIPILRALIQNLYEELDRKLHLNGAKVPITFGYDTDTLGSYTRRSAHEKEHFHFSLLFIAYGVKNPLSKEDRIDLFKHEYAHYMQYICRFPKSINGRQERTEVRGNTVVLLSERRRRRIIRRAKRL